MLLSIVGQARGRATTRVTFVGGGRKDQVRLSWQGGGSPPLGLPGLQLMKTRNILVVVLLVVLATIAYTLNRGGTGCRETRDRPQEISDTPVGHQEEKGPVRETPRAPLIKPFTPDRGSADHVQEVPGLSNQHGSLRGETLGMTLMVHCEKMR